MMDSISSNLDASMRTLFRRCLQCPNTPPSCPTCAADEVCAQTGQSCDACASSSCIKTGSVNPVPNINSPPHKKAPIAGAVAGGVIGGIALIILLTWLVWRFFIKRRREEYDENPWPEDDMMTEKDGDGFTARRDARASTHTVGSIASTVLTRASNVIQIAYIPGVTNRSHESSPDLLVPPVPPIPAASNPSSNASTPRHPQDQHFFMPGDLRDSTYSGYTDDGRISYARSSIAPSLARSSVATTIYRNNAIMNPVPAQTATRGKAVAVSVNPSGKNSPDDTPRSGTPAVPTVDPKHHQNILTSKSSFIGRIGTPKAVTITKSPSTKTSTTSPSSADQRSRADTRLGPNHIKRHSNDASTLDDPSSDEEDPQHAVRKSLMGHARPTQGSTRDEDYLAPDEAPYATPSFSPEPLKISKSTAPLKNTNQVGKGHKHKKSGSLNQIIQEATRRASRAPRHGGLGSMGITEGWKKDGGPFSDIYEAKTP